MVIPQAYRESAMATETLVPAPPGQHYATKSDLEALEERLYRELHHFATKADLAQLEVRLVQMEQRLLLRLGALMIALAGVIIAAQRFLG